MADSYRAKPRKIMTKRRREANPDFRTRVIERRPNHGDGYPLNKKLINRIIDIIPDEYLFGLKTIELKPRGDREFGYPAATYFKWEKRIEIYSMPFDEILIYHLSPLWKEILETWSMNPLLKFCDVLGYYYSSDYAQSSACYCIILFHEIGHHYSFNFKTRKRASDSKEGRESQAEIFAANIMKEVLNELKQIIPSPFSSKKSITIASRLLFLDDLRNPSDCLKYMGDRKDVDVNIYLKSWHIVRTYSEFVEWVETHGLPDFISFDHDLADFYNEGSREYTGMDCAKWLVEYCLDHNLSCPEFTVHSSNPAGADNIKALLNSFRKITKS